MLLHNPSMPRRLAGVIKPKIIPPSILRSPAQAQIAWTLCISRFTIQPTYRYNYFIGPPSLQDSSMSSLDRLVVTITFVIIGVQKLCTYFWMIARGRPSPGVPTWRKTILASVRCCVLRLASYLTSYPLRTSYGRTGYARTSQSVLSLSIHARRGS